jgi:hypothetical protein
MPGVPFTPNYWLTTPLSKAITVIFSVLPWDLLVKVSQAACGCCTDSQALQVKQPDAKPGQG